MNFKNIQEFFWPTIHDAESAKKAADQGFLAAMLYVFLALTPILSGQVAKIFDVLVVALAAISRSECGERRRSSGLS